MAKKPTISTVATGYQATDTINDNFTNVRNQFDNTLSRDGSTPNAMEADLDMNSNDILNVNQITANDIILVGIGSITQGPTGPTGPAGPPGPTPGIGGSNTQVQFNDAGAIAGNSNFTFNKTTNQIAIAAGSAAAPTLIPTGDTNTGIFFPAADTIAFSEGGTESMRIDSSGRLGIGTSAPDALLSVNGIASFGAGAVATPSIVAFGDLNTGMWFPAADTIAASTNGVERIRVTSTGNFGLGTSTFGTSAATVLSIATGTAPTTGPADTIQIFSTDLSAGNTMLSLRTEGTVVNSNATAAATHRIAIRVNGTVYYLLANTSA
jgi:hypothetical protein